MHHHASDCSLSGEALHYRTQLIQCTMVRVSTRIRVSVTGVIAGVQCRVWEFKVLLPEFVVCIT